MPDLSGFFGTALSALLVVLGFSAIVVVHELGHFLAARWAGIRVLAFAVFFGRAVCSYRRGLGFRWGSSEKEAARENLRRRDEADRSGRPFVPVSATEYRLNALPLGGYVKMLGQDDLNPTAKSGERDSYQSCAPWKRMIVISAGVVMNVIIAAVLFVVVFMIGLRTEPPIVGFVAPGSPAASAIAVNADSFPGQPVGLQAGDRVLGINGERPESFNDVAVAVAMSRRETPIEFVVSRSLPETDAELRFQIVPLTNPQTGMLSIGIGAASSAIILDPINESARAQVQAVLAEAGAAGIRAGDRLKEVNGAVVTDDARERGARGSQSLFGAHALESACANSKGAAVEVVFEGTDGVRTVRVQPAADLQTLIFAMGSQGRTGGGPGEAKGTGGVKGGPAAIRHLLGMAPAVLVESVSDQGKASGLQSGDIIAQLGTLEYPTWIQASPEIRANSGGTVRIVVRRRGAGGEYQLVDLGDVPVSKEGLVGFFRGDSADVSTFVAAWPQEQQLTEALLPVSAADQEAGSPPSWIGCQVVAVDGAGVADFTDIRAALVAAAERGAERVQIELKPPLENEPLRQETLVLSKFDRMLLVSLGWHSPIDASLFEPLEFDLVAADPVQAVGMGLRRTRQVMTSTYLTFARLFQGTVRIEHLKGPVGIAHTGTLIAERGIIWLIFFLALISVNLAVINFLPLPIVDGGHFLFLLYEQVTGKPVSIAVQAVTGYIGLAMVAILFLIVTFNDIRNLLG